MDSQGSSHPQCQIDSTMNVDTCEIGNVEPSTGIDDNDDHTPSDESIEDKATENSKEVDITVGMSFSSIAEAYKYYSEFALQHGFGVRINSSKKDPITGEIYLKRFVCNKEGFKRKSDGFTRLRHTRTGCKAFMEICVEGNEGWIVKRFTNNHNHDPTSATKVQKHRSHKKFQSSNACRGPSQISKVINVVTSHSAQLEIGVTPAHAGKNINKEHSINVGKDCYGIIQQFLMKAKEDLSYYFAFDLSPDGTLRNVFWADGISRAAYRSFGDVVMFDVTYKTKKFQLPFASFVGVNHHFQSILFGAALLGDETEETFTWLFNQFRDCMFHETPVAFITDQDLAMCNAIRTVFPSTKHRFCAWHIHKHLMEHLQCFRLSFPNFQEDFNHWLKSKSMEEFETLWEDLKVRWEVQPNSWLYNMYKLRHHWVKTYMKDIFWAGMTTSGRCESILSFFDGFVNSKTMLNEFVCQYDKAVQHRRRQEYDADFKTLNSAPTLVSPHGIERKGKTSYTCALFDKFQKEWRDSIGLSHSTVTKENGITIYLVGSADLEESTWRNVTFGSNLKLNVVCSCSKYETHGIPCKHILYVLRKKRFQTLPNEYILSRWCIKSRHHSGIQNSKAILPNEIPIAIQMYSLFNEAFQIAKESVAGMDELKGCLSNYIKNTTNPQKQ